MIKHLALTIELVTGLMIGLAMRADPAAASTADDTQVAQAALSQCLGGSPSQPPAPSSTSDLPPGLWRTRDLHVDRLPGLAHAYRYVGIGQHEEACGIAIYGPVSPSTVKALTAQIDGLKPKWVRHPPYPDELGHAKPATPTYWGDPMAPGMYGVLMLYRHPAADAPTLEIDAHRALVF